MGGGGCQGPAVPVGRSRVREEPAAPPEAIKPQAGEGAFASPALSPRCQALPVTSRLLHRECGDSPGTGLGSWGGPVEGRCPLGKAGTPGREMSPWGRGGGVSLEGRCPLGWTRVSGVLWGGRCPLGMLRGGGGVSGERCPLWEMGGGHRRPQEGCVPLGTYRGCPWRSLGARCPFGENG